MYAPFYITTSWDDGHPSDLRVAELLAQYGLQGTFYVPSRNVEGRPVMAAKEVQALGRAFEVGAHSRDHVRLTKLGNSELREQISDNKLWLQDTLGRDIDGFCYIQGRYNRRVLSEVKQLNFFYARTVQGLACKAGFNRYLMPTSLQFYPHRPSTLVRNFIRHPNSALTLLLATLASQDLVSRVRDALLASQSQGEYFHLWGHSWELDAHGLWGKFEQTLGVLSDAVAAGAVAASNVEIATAFSAPTRA